MRIGMRFGIYALMLGVGTIGLTACSSGSGPQFQGNLNAQAEPLNTSEQEPVDIEVLENYEPKSTFVAPEIESSMPFDIRAEAVREAAFSFGARGGLAKRSFEIRQEMVGRERQLDKIYNFNQLLISAPSGFLIEPPVVTESMNAMLIDPSGQTAAVSDAIFNITENAKIVSAPRNWRVYLEREWGEVLPPPDILLPQTEEERKIWIESVREGWKMGYEQADDIFADDLARLNSDFEGMIRYRMLLSQGMVSPPYALQIDRGVTGGGEEMRVGDRAVQITGMPELVTGADQWKPASR